jgi:hypothetical protein
MERIKLQLNLTTKKHASERGELLDYFFNLLSPTWGGQRPLTKSYLAMKISHLELPDLYYLKSSVQDRVNRGENYSKYFWGVLKIKN